MRGCPETWKASVECLDLCSETHSDRIVDDESFQLQLLLGSPLLCPIQLYVFLVNHGGNSRHVFPAVRASRDVQGVIQQMREERIELLEEVIRIVCCVKRIVDVGAIREPDPNGCIECSSW